LDFLVAEIRTNGDAPVSHAVEPSSNGAVVPRAPFLERNSQTSLP
jgi:hypothetical protein